MGFQGRTVLAVLGAAGLLGCHRGEAPREAGPPRVALVLKTLNSPFFIDMQRGAQEAAARLKVELVVQAADREVDVEKQMQIIENLIQTGVKALCVTPSGSKEIVPALVKANRAGIPVVVLDTRVDPKAAAEAGLLTDSFVGSDNYEGGRIAGAHLLAITGGKARVAILEGIPGHETGDSRLKGFRDAVKDAPGIRVLASQTANWERDQGFTVFGFDAVEDARKAIATGAMVASVAQFPSEMGRIAVESAAKLLRGEKPPADQRVRIELVTKDNLAAR